VIPDGGYGVYCLKQYIMPYSTTFYVSRINKYSIGIAVQGKAWFMKTTNDARITIQEIIYILNRLPV